jgi:hypothetical protein
MAVVSLVLVASSKANLPERNHRLLFAQNTLRYQSPGEAPSNAQQAIELWPAIAREFGAPGRSSKTDT